MNPSCFNGPPVTSCPAGEGSPARRTGALGLCRLIAAIFWLLASMHGQLALAQSRDYLIGPGDALNIKVFESPELSVEVRVSETGSVAYPLLGEIRLAGLTAAAAGELITKRLREGNLVRQPNVSVVVMQFRSLQISILGQVAKPGRYPLEQAATPVTEAIAIAGGMLPTASDSVWLIRREGEQERKIEIDIPEILRAGDLAKDQQLRNGDTIFVPRAPVFYIYGEAQRPGQYRIERNMNVMQALAAGGGPTPRGSDRGLRLTRRDERGNLVTREARPNDSIMPDDILHVRERLF